MRLFSHVSIVIFWLAMMGSFVFLHVLPERRQARYAIVEPEILAIQWWNVQEWNWIQKGGATRGASRLSIIQPFDPAETPAEKRWYDLTQNLALNIPILGVQRRMESQVRLKLSGDFKVQEFAAQLQVTGIAFETEGFVQQNRLYFRLRRVGQDWAYGFLKLEEPISLLAAVEPLITRHRELEAGDKWAVQVVDPLGRLKPQTVKVTVLNQERISWQGEQHVEAWKLENRLGDIVRHRWVDENGVTLRSELFQGYSAVRGIMPEVSKAFPELAEARKIPEWDRAEFRNQAHAGGETVLPKNMKTEGLLPWRTSDGP